MQAHTNTDILGIDVSNHQYDIDWQKAHSSRPDIKYALIKSSEGISYRDPYYLKNVQGAKAVGILVSPYDFGRPDQDSDPIAEAKFFLSIIQSAGFDLMPVLDVEVGNGSNLSQWIRLFVNYVKQQTGIQVMLYSGNWFVDSRHITALSDIPLWISNYSGLSAPPDTGGWTKWVEWQFTDNGQIPGIKGAVDMNYAASIDALKTGVIKTVYQSIKVQLNGAPFTDGIVVGPDTYVIWKALEVFNIPHTYKGNGLMNINGKDVQGVIYGPDTYLPWNSLDPNIKPLQIEGGWNFVLPQQQIQPAPSNTLPFAQKEAEIVSDLLDKVFVLTSDTKLQSAIQYASDSVKKAVGISKQQ